MLYVVTAFAEATEATYTAWKPHAVASSSKPNTELRDRISPMPTPGRALAPSLVPAWFVLVRIFFSL